MRYKTISNVNIGDRILFDNTTNFIKDVAKVKIVGEILEILSETEVKIAFKVNGINESVIRKVPFYLCQ